MLFLETNEERFDIDRKDRCDVLLVTWVITLLLRPTEKDVAVEKDDDAKAAVAKRRNIILATIAVVQRNSRVLVDWLLRRTCTVAG